MANSLRQRLLHDIAELQAKPYPNIALHIHDEDITTACLVLKAPYYGRMHLTIDFPSDYPLHSPSVHMDSDIKHPNIFGNYICASILNTKEGYTSAYTLKGIAIQLLSFFTSDNVEQVGGGYSVDLSTYRRAQSYIHNSYRCAKCQFGKQTTTSTSTSAVPSLGSSPSPPPSITDLEQWPTPQQTVAHESVGRTAKRRRARANKAKQDFNPEIPSSTPSIPEPVRAPKSGPLEQNVPDEVLLLLCEQLETEDLMSFAEAWGKIGHLMTNYDIIRTRELQCFCLKKDYKVTKLGVGVNVIRKGRFGSLESEFDLLSDEGFKIHRIRRSVQGVAFEHWLPLPISNGHWRKVKGDVDSSLSALTRAVGLEKVPPVQVLFHFMNDIVVKLNQQASESTTRSPYYPFEEVPKSSLTHASEKAIESYFHLFHLLLCLATSQPSIVQSANNMIRKFTSGGTSKIDCPNLGHLLIAALISDIDINEKVVKPIIKETVTRNVVWMLDSKGSNMPELSYLEPSGVSHYRLQKTFEASKTSYRLLMFLNIFRQAAVGSPRKPLSQLRDEAFGRHGAPPHGSAKVLADSIKLIHQVNNFPTFLRYMGVNPVPTAAWFTNLLRTCICDSHSKGYSSMPISQAQALTLRLEKEPGVEVKDDFSDVEVMPGLRSRITFFPNKDRGRGGQRGGRGGYGGRGGRGGRGGY